MEQVLANPDLIRRLAADFVLHYERRVEEGATVEGKAMIVCATSEIGYAIYKEIVKLRPEWTEVRPCADGEQLTEQEKEKIRPIEKIKMVFIRQRMTLRNCIIFSDLTMNARNSTCNSKNLSRTSRLQSLWICGLRDSTCRA